MNSIPMWVLQVCWGVFIVGFWVFVIFFWSSPSHPLSDTDGATRYRSNDRADLDSWLRPLFYSAVAYVVAQVVFLVFEHHSGYEFSVSGEEKEYFLRCQRTAKRKTSWVVAVGALFFLYWLNGNWLALGVALVVNWLLWNFVVDR